MMPARNEELGLFVSTACCAETRAEAQDIARDVALGYFEFIDLYRPLATQQGYEYLHEVNRIVDNVGNLDFLLTETASVMIGTPEGFVARLRELEERGIDEVVMRIDGIGHENQLCSLELIGAQVIPTVDPAAAVSS